MVKRKKYILRYGAVIDVEEYHDGRYGAKGVSRREKKNPTPEQVQQANERNRARLCRRKLIEYFTPGDCFATWTYRPENRPPDMKGVLADFQKAMRAVRKEYRKRGRKLYWIRNIEKGTRGAWHIHLVFNEIGDTASIITKAWKHGGTWVTEIRTSRYAGEDFEDLANYITKSEHTVTCREDGTREKPRIAESSYSTSRNMPLPEPEDDKLVYWKKEAKPIKGYYISSLVEGINPVTGYKYRRYTMQRLKGEENVAGKPLHHHRPERKGKRKGKGGIRPGDKKAGRQDSRKQARGSGISGGHGKEAGAVRHKGRHKQA